MPVVSGWRSWRLSSVVRRWKFRVTAGGGLRGTVQADLSEYLVAGQRALAAAGEAEWPDDHYSIDSAKAAFFASGTMAQLRRPRETIEHATEVVRASQSPRTRNFWPMRVANARVEWALAEVGDEDEAAAMAGLALDRQWFRPDTERRMHTLLRRMRDPHLQARLVQLLREVRAG